MPYYGCKSKDEIKRDLSRLYKSHKITYKQYQVALHRYRLA